MLWKRLRSATATFDWIDFDGEFDRYRNSWTFDSDASVNFDESGQFRTGFYTLGGYTADSSESKFLLHGGRYRER